jgi:hypothetical protein
MLNEAQKTRHLPFMQGIADADVIELQQKDREYGASWKSRGGVGAFMMLARKWDRLENMVKVDRDYHKNGDAHQFAALHASQYDIFAHAAGSHEERGDAESLLDTIGDLRRYLLLVESEVIAARPGAIAPGKAEALVSGHLTVPDPRADGQRLYDADQRRPHREDRDN